MPLTRCCWRGTRPVLMEGDPSSVSGSTDKGEDLMRRFIATMAAAALLAAPAVVGPSAAFAATQDGLVNVYVNDVEIAKDVNVAAVVPVIANVCANVDADVAALASLVDQTDQPQTIDCKATGDKITIAQN